MTEISKNNKEIGKTIATKVPINIHNQLININYNNQNISNYIEVNFKRKNKIYNKNIYFYITNTMETILGKTEAISQGFKDCTYYAIPRNNNEFKLLLLIGYNNSENKTLGAIMLIKNENKETFLSIFNYLES